MKKILGIVFIVIILVVVCFGFWYLTPLSSIPVQRVLPVKPLAYIQVSNAQKYLEKFQRSGFGSEILKININPLVRNNEQLNIFFHSVKALQDQTNTPEIQEYINKFLGQEVAIAFYKADSEKISAVSKADVASKQGFPEIFLVSRVPADIKLKERLLRFSSQKKSSAELNLERTSYRGYLIYLLPVADMGVTISFTRIGDLVVAALNDQMIRKSIDIYKNIRPSLSRDEHFQASLKVIAPSDSLVSVYWDTVEVLSMLSTLLHSQQQADVKLNEALNNFKGLTTGGISAAWSGGLKIKNEMYFNPDQLSNDMKSYVQGCKQGDNQSLLLVPKDVLLYHSLGCLNFNQYWQKIKREIVTLEQQRDIKDSSQDAIQSFQALLGLNIEKDVLPVLGSEVGWFANAGIQTVPLLDIKIPQIAIFLRINDLDKAKKVMAVLVGKIPMPSKRQIVEGEETIFIETPLGMAVEPGYMFLGDYVVIGLNLDILKEAAYARRDKRVSLGSNESFKKVVQSAGEDNQIGVFYFRLRDVLERYSGLIDMAHKWVAAQSQVKQEQADGRPLAGMDQRIASLDKEFARAQKDLADLDHQIWDMGLKGEDAGLQNQQKKTLEAKIVSLEEDLQRTKAQRMEEAQKNAALPKIDHTAAVWRNVMEPMLEALEHVQVIGVSSNILKDRFSTNIHIQMDK